MTRSMWRVWQAATADELTPHTGIDKACELVGRSRATPLMLGVGGKPRLHRNHQKGFQQPLGSN